MTNSFMQLHPLTIDDKSTFDQFNTQTHLTLSHYAFAPIYIWQEFYSLHYLINKSTDNKSSSYSKIDTNPKEYLCIFAKQGKDYYMPILPIPCEIEEAHYQKIVRDSFQFMLESNRNPQFARIENVPVEFLPIFKDVGFEVFLKESEYLYETKRIGNLKGDDFKGQRNVYNSFIKHNPTAKFEPYEDIHLDECLKLYETWQNDRSKKYDDSIYQAMLEDSKSAHTIGISNSKKLGLIGRIVRINNEVQAYTFGYALNSDTFCILFEISNLSIKGLAQYIYREFCKELLITYKWINAMDDSGLENIKRVKMSYHPTQIIPSYNITKHK
ncbi:DUF2156 domain-containing protein [Candidatus Poribacteria bacterium]|nr:DUF2156 domain-containing protein [Candidatus Poribacteria bacterium]